MTTNPEPSLLRRLIAETQGTMLLVAVVVGSGIMAHDLSGGNTGLALLGNTLATAAILPVLIIMFGPLSGAHFNPVVSLVFALRSALSAHRAALYIAAQIVGAAGGTLLAHMMFSHDIIAMNGAVRSGGGLWLSEIIATFGLVLTILAGVRHRPDAVPYMVGLYIAAGYWFTASTCFANPAVTIARALTDSFSGIAPASVPAFIAAQIAGGLMALGLFGYLFPDKTEKT